jgi:hypothetical protein
MECSFRDMLGCCEFEPTCGRKEVKCCLICGKCNDRKHKCVSVVEYIEQFDSLVAAS